MKHGLPPIVDENSRIVILGTLPGDLSLREQQYYADPSNQFWVAADQGLRHAVREDLSGSAQIRR
jgi:hypoxanthine-DNA glycosylase